MKKLLLLMVALGLGLMVAPAFGQLDPQIYVCQSCTSSPGGDPNLITDTTGFNVGWDGNHTSVSPLLIIVGTYNGAAAPTVSYGSQTFSPGGTAIYGWDGSSTAVTMDAGSGTKSAYDLLNISPQDGGASEKFGNWTAGEEKYGQTAATSFSLYVYELSGVTLPRMQDGNITIDLEGATVGSYVLAYACESSVSPCPSNDTGATPFTNSGLVGTPEPGSMVLFGTGLLALGGAIRRRFHK